MSVAKIGVIGDAPAQTEHSARLDAVEETADRVRNPRVIDYA